MTYDAGGDLHRAHAGARPGAPRTEGPPTRDDAGRCGPEGRTTVRTVGGWVRLHDADRAAAWEELWYAMSHAARRRRWGVGSGHIEPGDVASEAATRVMEHGARTARNADPDTDLDAWCRGVVVRVAADLARADRRADPGGGRGALVEDAAVVDPRSDPDPVAAGAVGRTERGGRSTSSDDADLAARLDACRATGFQREIHRLRFVEGRSVHAVARALGRDPKTVRESLSRFVRKLVVPPAPPRTADRAWAAAALADARADVRTATVLEMHLAGRTHAEIAAATGVTKSAVAARVQRARRRWIRNSVGPEASD